MLPHSAPRRLQGKGSLESLKERFPFRKLTRGFHPEYLFEVSRKLSFQNSLWTQGEILSGDHRAVAIVGSRVCSSEAEKRAYNLASALVRQGSGIRIVSGLAFGIDIAAHTGAVESAGRTLMVLGNGLSQVRPCVHRKFYTEVISSSSGAGLSPFYPEFKSRRDGRNYLERNKLIAALSQVVVVAEAQQRSGSMSCVLAALTRGIPVGFLPHMMKRYWVQDFFAHNLLGDLLFVAHTPEDVLKRVGS